MSPIAPALTGGPALVAQVGREAAGNPQIDPGIGFLGSLVLYLVVGGLLLAFARGTTDATVEYARRRPLYSGLVGLGTWIAVVVVMVVLAVTVVGLVVAIPAGIVFAIVGIVGTTCMAILLGSVIADLLGSEGRGVELALGAVVLSAVSIVPVLGDLVGLVTGAVGVGALLLVVFVGPEGGSGSETRSEIPGERQSRSRDRGSGRTDGWSEFRR